MEKRAVIEEGRTPPEKAKPAEGEKKAGQDLAEHTTKRLQEAAERKPQPTKGT